MTQYIQLKTKEQFKEVTKNTKWEGKDWMWNTFRENTCFIPCEGVFISLDRAIEFGYLELV